jgi:hypothetical protein
MCDMQKHCLCISVQKCRLAVIARAPFLGDFAGSSSVEWVPVAGSFAYFRSRASGF